MPITGEFTGFTDLGDINTHNANFEAQVHIGTKPLAKSMLGFMVRGLNSGLQFPYVQIPCDSLRGDQLFHLVWKVIGQLKRFGFHVMGITGYMCTTYSVLRIYVHTCRCWSCS